MYVVLIVLLVTSIGAQYQYQCSCSCCLGQSCQPVIVGTVSVQNCSSETCLSQCRCTYPQCAANSPYGQLLSQCTSPINNLFSCRCDCCKTGSPTCLPTLVGFTSAYLCQPSACAIACYTQYPSQCVSNNNGQIQGTCIGAVTTTTTSTTMISWLGNICSCLYCQSGYTCSSNMMVGIASVSQCSSSDCTQACQNRYQSSCSTSYLNQISGVCLNQAGGKVKCKCNCCSGNGCLDYEININETCSSCSTKCQQAAPCINTRPITYTCLLNNSNNFYFSFIILTLTIVITSFI